MSKDEDMSSYLMRISQLRYQLQGLGEVISYSEMTTCVKNDLPPKWRNFATSVYIRKNTTPFDELWAQCILEETRIKEKDDTKLHEKSQAFFVKYKKKKRKFGKSKEKHDMSKIQCYGCNGYGNFNKGCPNNPQNKKDNKRKE